MLAYPFHADEVPPHVAEAFLFPLPGLNADTNCWKEHLITYRDCLTCCRPLGKHRDTKPSMPVKHQEACSM